MQQLIILEEKCIGCGQAFDLSYDLDVRREVGEEELAEISKRVEKNGKNTLRHLCWDCRKVR